MGRLLFIVECKTLLSKENVTELKQDIAKQIEDGVLIKDQTISRIVLVDTEKGLVGEI